MSFDDDVRENVSASRALSERLTALIEGTPRPRLASQMLLELRCGHRCELLVVYATRVGSVGYSKPYRLSPSKTAAATAAAAREKRTSDGYRRWKGRAFRIGGWSCDGDQDQSSVTLEAGRWSGSLPT